MVEEDKQKTEDEPETKIDKTVDPYTGELVPVPEDAHQFIEVVPEETDDRAGPNYLLKEETSMDSYAADADADAGVNPGKALTIAARSSSSSRSRDAAPKRAHFSMSAVCFLAMSRA